MIMLSTLETCVSLQSHHMADHRQIRSPETPLWRAPASPPTARWLGVGLSFAEGLAGTGRQRAAGLCLGTAGCHAESQPGMRPSTTSRQGIGIPGKYSL